jgi:hypothetical protein
MTPKKSKPRLSQEGVRGLAYLLAGVLLLIVIALAPFVWQLSLSPQLSEKRDFLTLLEAKARANPRQATALDPQTVETIFIKGSTSGLAAAGFQRLLVDMAGKSGMVIERTRPLPTDNRQGLATVRMEVNASGSIEALRDYLHGIETGAPLIFVDQVHIATGPAVPDGVTSDNLSVRLELEAFAWWEKAS